MPVDQQIRVRRPPTKRRLIVRTLRSEIIAGVYAPGAMLPSRAGLSERFDASPMTVQAAVDELTRDGYVVARGWRGTFAADYPPHLYHYGLVFGGHPLAPSPTQDSPFWRALHEHAVHTDWADRRVRFTMYYYLDAGTQHPDYDRLVADVRAQRLAGLILTNPWRMRPWAEELRMPMVMFGPNRPGAVGPAAQPFHALNLDMGAFRDLALDDLASRGVRRVGFLVGHESALYFDSLRTAAGARGLEVRGEWVQGVALDQPHWAWHAVLAMMRRPRGERPEALVIADDSLLEPAATALREAGVHAPQDVLVTAHANFPLAAPSPVPARRLGFPVQTALQTAMNVIQQLRRGKNVPVCTNIAPVFASQVNQPETVGALG